MDITLGANQGIKSKNEITHIEKYYFFLFYMISTAYWNTLVRLVRFCSQCLN